ncbi:unnamed protein product [Rangifer tarandus platyrhynchus]|uniref:Uncharacterized protein n=2 Tax=Rangifer tarandus platyrhynchus TaxID=3082113 RepID=A0ABN8YFL7_RANTA|nr:unnamed protein product [Rangifer tarandus platyrhynchus]
MECKEPVTLKWPSSLQAVIKESSLIGYYSSHGQSHEQVQEDHEAASFTQTPIVCISFVDPNPPLPLTVNKILTQLSLGTSMKMQTRLKVYITAQIPGMEASLVSELGKISTHRPFKLN